MFDFNNLSKIFKYDWSNIINMTLPEKNKEVMDEKSYNDIISGVIFKIAADILNIIVTVGFSFALLSFSEGARDILKPFGFGPRIDVNISFPFIFSLVILVYTIIMKDKAQSSIPTFAVAWAMGIQTIISLFSIVKYFIALFINPFFALLGIIAWALVIVGNINVFVGCVDFSIKAKNAYKKNNTVKPTESKIKTKAINPNDVSDHTTRICPSCGKRVSKTAAFCKNCGTKLD